MKDYQHILFDLDHTLWDYDTNAKETLYELYDEYGLGSFGYFSVEQLIDSFFRINQELWAQYNVGEISKYYIRQQRFGLVFSSLGLPEKFCPADFDKKFILSCPLKTNVIPNALEVLEYLAPKYKMHIITNGFNDVQGAKMTNSGLGSYFQHVVTSESCGAKKPSKRIFDYTLNKIGANPDECIMIGDNLQTDIIGAKNAAIDQVFFNPQSAPHNEQVTIEISDLRQLKKHL